MEARAGLRVLRMGHTAYLRDLETALRTGSPVLLEDIGETLDPALEPLLLKQARSCACLQSASLANHWLALLYRQLPCCKDSCLQTKYTYISLVQ